MLARLFAEIQRRTRKFRIACADLSIEPVPELAPAAMSVSAETRVYGELERTVPIACATACLPAFGIVARQGLLITASTCLNRHERAGFTCRKTGWAMPWPIPVNVCVALLGLIGKVIA